jgi:predicted permease
MKKVLEKISIMSVGLLAAPMFVFAQVNTAGLRGLLREIHGLISLVIPVLIALGVLAFMWGIVMYLFGKNKEEGKSFMLWGIIALFVMTSVWGLVGILRGTLFGNNADPARQVSIPPLNN